MSGEEANDDLLMEKIAKGDKLAFKTLFKKHGGHLLGYAQRYLKQKEKAEELTQEIWMKVIRLAPSYKPEGHFVAWLYAMTRNLCLNNLRSENRLVATEDIDEKIDSESIERESMENEVLQKKDFEQIKKAIDNLPDAQRSALLLYVVEEMSYEDIGRELSTSLSAVKSLIFRARKSLQGHT